MAYKTSRKVLDRKKPLELVLEILSFAAGENTRDEDSELKSNEARLIENWDPISLGGMIRSKGFNQTAEVANVDTYTKLLLHFDGANAAVTTIDTVAGKAVTFNNNAEISTTQEKFGPSSLGLASATSDSIHLADHADWNFGAGDFTIDKQWWIETDQDSVLCGQFEDADNYWHIKYDQVNSLLIFFWRDGGADRADYEVAWNPNTGEFYHIEVSRATTTMQMFINGVKQTLTETTAIGATTLADIAAALYIGQLNGGDYVDGFIDEFRICKGIARHTATFTAPTAGYVVNAPLDLLIHHDESLSTELYGVIKGDLISKSGSGFACEFGAGFTTGVLCHGVSAGNKLWITNATDNLKYKTIAGHLIIPDDQPTAARDRIHEHKFRLIAEGGGKVVYGSKAGVGNWTDADAWSAATDAWNITMPDYTHGCVPGFPSGNEAAVFTRFACFSLYGFPSTAYRHIANSRGCFSGYTVAKGDEGVYFFSDHPTKAIILWNGVNWVDLTAHHTFVSEINMTSRMFGRYRDRKYYFFYNETGSGVTYPNRCKIFHAEFGRWQSRPVAAGLSEAFGYPAVLKYDNQELYVGSSVNGRLYELETTDDSDEGENTQALYRTKYFSSKDFSILGQRFPVDNVRLKLTKMIVTYWGSTGSLNILYNMDRGARSGSQTFVLSDGIEGDKLDVDFTLGTSLLVDLANIPDRTITRSFANRAVGRNFQLEISNLATGNRPKVKSIKIHAIAIEES